MMDVTHATSWCWENATQPATADNSTTIRTMISVAARHDLQYLPLVVNALSLVRTWLSSSNVRQLEL